MDAFALLKYWRSGAGGSGAATIITAADARAAPETVADDVGPYSSDGEDGPYIDLEFAGEEPQSKSPGSPEETETEDEETESGDEGELKFALASGAAAAAALSPSDEVFFRGDLASIENSKLPVFLAKSATKFRVLLLKLKKSKSRGGESAGDDGGKNENSPSGKFAAVKYKVDEGPLMSLFTRDSSSKENGHVGGKGQKGHFAEESVGGGGVSEATTEERKLTKEMVQKYLKMVKPFYVRVSKLRFSGNSAAAAKAQSLHSGLKVVRKRLGKSRSASAAVAAAASNRRETSLPDGIEGAILHCKRSFNASSRDAEASSILCRSVSDPSNEKSAENGVVLRGSERDERLVY